MTDDIVHQYCNLYKNWPVNIDADNHPSDSGATLNFEQELFNMDNDLDEKMNCNQYTTTETAPKPIWTVNSPPTSLAVRQIRKRLRYVSTWDRHLAYMTFHGSVTFTKDQYRILTAAVVNTSSVVITLHHIIVSSTSNRLSLGLFSSHGTTCITSRLQILPHEEWPKLL